MMQWSAWSGLAGLSAFWRVARALGAGCLLGPLLTLDGALAQTGRDPTRPPAGATGASAPPSAAPAVPDTGPVAVIVREGQPYLVVGTRLYAQGQMLGGARIERISETEVWLREGKTLHRKPIFPGIVRSVAGAAPVRADCPSDPPAPQRRGGPAPAARKAAQPGPDENCKP